MLGIAVTLAILANTFIAVSEKEYVADDSDVTRLAELLPESTVVAVHANSIDDLVERLSDVFTLQDLFTEDELHDLGGGKIPETLERLARELKNSEYVWMASYRLSDKLLSCIAFKSSGLAAVDVVDASEEIGLSPEVIEKDDLTIYAWHNVGLMCFEVDGLLCFVRDQLSAESFSELIASGPSGRSLHDSRKFQRAFANTRDFGDVWFYYSPQEHMNQLRSQEGQSSTARFVSALSSLNFISGSLAYTQFETADESSGLVVELDLFAALPARGASSLLFSLRPDALESAWDDIPADVDMLVALNLDLPSAYRAMSQMIDSSQGDGATANFETSVERAVSIEVSHFIEDTFSGRMFWLHRPTQTVGNRGFPFDLGIAVEDSNGIEQLIDQLMEISPKQVDGSPSWERLDVGRTIVWKEPQSVLDKRAERAREFLTQRGLAEEERVDIGLIAALTDKSIWLLQHQNDFNDYTATWSGDRTSIRENNDFNRVRDAVQAHADGRRIDGEAYLINGAPVTWLQRYLSDGSLFKSWNSWEHPQAFAQEVGRLRESIENQERDLAGPDSFPSVGAYLTTDERSGRLSLTFIILGKSEE